jgi:hypothetical protein
VVRRIASLNFRGPYDQAQIEGQDNGASDRPEDFKIQIAQASLDTLQFAREACIRFN